MEPRSSTMQADSLPSEPPGYQGNLCLFHFSLSIWGRVLLTSALGTKPQWLKLKAPSHEVSLLAPNPTSAHCIYSLRLFTHNNKKIKPATTKLFHLRSSLLLSHFSRVLLCATPETAAHQAPLSLGFSRQEHWSGLPFPSPMHESEKWKWSHSVVSDS